MAILYKSIDTMKASRDSNTWTNQQKVDHINAIVLNIPDITHITVDCFYDMPAYHSYAYIQQWIDAIRSTGKKVWFRGVPSYSTSTNSAAEAITITVADIEAHPTWFENGDIFEYHPESGPYGFTDGWNNNGTAWSQWHADMVSACNTAFLGMGKSGVITDIQSIVSSYWTQGDVKSSALTAFNNTISIDYYPLDSPDPTRAVKTMMSTLLTLHTAYPTAGIVISEIGCSNTTSSSDSGQREVLRSAFNALAQLDYIKGVNYWVGYNTSNGGGYTQLFQTGSRTVPRPALKTLSEFYTKGYCSARMDVI